MNKLESQIENGTCIPPTVWDITEKVNEIIDFLNKKECEDTEIAPPKHAVVTVEKKLRWSEEDEEMLERLDDLLWILDSYIGDDCSLGQEETDSIRSEIQNVLSPFVKSLRPQPKRDCKDCAMFLNGKCTKPRWKPSEEQIEELNKARRFIPYNCDILAELYEQLKAL